MKILVVFALENEFAPWKAMCAFHPVKWGTARVHAAKFGGTEVGVLLTGVGRGNARRKIAETNLEECGPIDFIVSSGLAGGLRPEYKIGQVLAAKDVLSAEASERMPGSAHLIQLASECGASAVDSFFSADHVITSANEKRAIGALANAVEMESFDVLRGAAGMGVPAVAVRAISDTSADDMPVDMNRVFTADGEVSITRVLGEVARRPRSVFGLVRLSRCSRLAAKSLALFLNSFVQKLADLPSLVEKEVAVAHG